MSLNIRNSEVEDLTRNIVTCGIKNYMVDSRIDGKQKNVENEFVQNKLEYTDNIENGFLENKRYWRYLKLSNIGVMFLVIKIVMGFVYYELDVENGENAEFGLNIAFAIHFLYMISKCMTEIARYDTLKGSSLFQYSISKSVVQIGLISFMYPQPWLNNIFITNSYKNHDNSVLDYPFKINYLLVIVGMFLSAIQIIFSVFLNTIYNGPRAKRICLIYQLKHQDLYTFKCLFRDKPIHIFASIFFSAWAFFSFALRVVEGGVPIDRNPFRFYQNCFWYSGVTASTTGFGDMTIKSNIGVFITLFCSLWGTFNVSIILVLLLNTLRLGQKERKALSTMNKVSQSISRKQLSGMYIRKAVYRLWLNKKQNLKLQQSLEEKSLRRKLSHLRKVEKLSQPSEDVSTCMQKQFDNVFIDIEILIENNERMLSHVGKDMFLKSQVGIQTHQDQVGSRRQGDSRRGILVSRENGWEEEKSLEKIELASRSSACEFPEIILLKPKMSRKQIPLESQNRPES